VEAAGVGEFSLASASDVNKRFSDRRLHSDFLCSTAVAAVEPDQKEHKPTRNST